MIALVGGRLIDGTGRDPVEDATVIIEEQKVTKTGPKAQIELPPDCQVIDVAGMTVMPGLMDLHVHLCLGKNEMVQWSWGVYPPQFENHLATIGLRAFDRARKTLAMGFTTIRDVGDIGWVIVAVRDAINAGLVEGPRIIASGPYLNTTAGHGNGMPPWLTRNDIGSSVVDGVDEVIKAVRQDVHMNTDWVKFCPSSGATRKKWDQAQFTIEEIQALVKEAHAKERPVCAHCVTAGSTLTAVKEGVDSVEHGCELTEETIDLMVKQGTFLVPTLYAANAILERGKEFGFTDAHIASVKPLFESHLKSFRRALEAGVQIALGTDAGYGPPLHGTNAYELELMVANGMTPMQALVAATSNAATCLRRDDELGTLEDGKLADLVVVRGDPIKDIKLLQQKANIALVMQAGTIFTSSLAAQTES